MKVSFKIYGRKYNDWFYVDTFLRKQDAVYAIKRMLDESSAYRAFAKYVEFEIRESYTWE